MSSEAALFSLLVFLAILSFAYGLLSIIVSILESRPHVKTQRHQK